jgi:tetratricopeptide (TPR) repeat protein
MGGAEPAFQERVRAQFASLTAAMDRQAPDAQISDAFGEVGRLLVASEFYLEAEPFLLNAQSLAPSVARWPYYLGHALRLRNQRDRAIEQFERVLTLQPDDVPALVWLGALRLDRGEADAADPLFSRAVALQPKSVAALSGLGRTRFARGDLASARQHLEAALTADPSAATVRYALAMTYRRLGETSRAEAELVKWKSASGSPADTLRDGQIPPDDRLMDEIGSLLDTAIAYEIRGTRALDAQQWAEAIALFRQALEVAPRDPALHQNLGSALYLAGDQRTAEAEFTEALRLAPGYARAHFSLGVISEERGQDQEAIARFAEAVRHFPDMVDARFKLADALRRTGRVNDALPHYRQIFESDSSASQARFGYAMGLVRLGRYAEARAELESSTRLFADQPGFAHALARVLAAAPDDAVRDGKRALVMVDALEAQYGATPALIETRAMALAELGRFKEAAARQREATAAALRQGRRDVAARMRENEEMYARGMPPRIPWRDDDPVHRPISGGVQ